MRAGRMQNEKFKLRPRVPRVAFFILGFDFFIFHFWFAAGPQVEVAP